MRIKNKDRQESPLERISSQGLQRPAGQRDFTGVYKLVISIEAGDQHPGEFARVNEIFEVVLLGPEEARP